MNPGSFPSPVLKINKPFTELTDITADTKGVLLKSRTGTGKSTLAFEKCRKLLEADPSSRILYIVSSRALAWSSTSSFNEKWTTYMFDRDLKPRFTCYMSEPGPLSQHQLVVCSIQSCWRTCVNRKSYSLVIIDEIASCLEDACYNSEATEILLRTVEVVFGHQ